MGRVKASKKAEHETPVIPMKKTRGKRYSEQEKALILERAADEIRNGGQITKIADKLGVTFFTLKAWLKEKGVIKVSGASSAKKGKSRVAKQVAADHSTAVRSKAPKVPRASRSDLEDSPQVDVPAYVRELERKVEELMKKTKKLSHLYGELKSEVGIGD